MASATFSPARARKRRGEHRRTEATTSRRGCAKRCSHLRQAFDAATDAAHPARGEPHASHDAAEPTGRAQEDLHDGRSPRGRGLDRWRGGSQRRARRIPGIVDKPAGQPRAHGASPSRVAPRRQAAAAPRGVPRLRRPRRAPRRRKVRADRSSSTCLALEALAARARRWVSRSWAGGWRRLRGARRAGAARASVYAGAEIQVLPGAAVAAILGETATRRRPSRNTCRRRGRRGAQARIRTFPRTHEPEPLRSLRIALPRRPRRAAAAPRVGRRRVLCGGREQQRELRGALAGLGLGPAIASRAGGEIPRGAAALPGCLRAGLVYLPLNSAYQEGEIGVLPRECGARRGDRAAAIDAAGCAPRRQAWASARVLARRAWRRHVARSGARGSARRFATVERSGDDLAAILYTSGTTGRSKGAMLTHRNLGRTRDVLHGEWGFRPDDVLVHMLPLFHVHGLFVACHCVLMNGIAMRFHAKFDAAQCARRLRELDRVHGRAHVLYAAARRSRASRAKRARTCGSSCRARRRCSPRRTSVRGAHRHTASSSATA